MFSFEAQPFQVKSINPKTQKCKLQRNSLFGKKEERKVKQRQYIEILPGKISNSNQSYFHINQPKKAVYKPLPGKIDKGSQIDRLDPDLFMFDNEVEPILQVMVAKVIQVAEQELFEEKETIEKIKKSQKYSLQRNAQIIKTQRMVNKQERLKTEIQKRTQQCQLYQQGLESCHQKLYAKNFVKKLICNDMISNSLDSLQQKKCLGFDQNKLLQISMREELLNNSDQRSQNLKNIESGFQKQIETNTLYILKQHQNKMQNFENAKNEQEQAQKKLKEQQEIQRQERKKITKLKKISQKKYDYFEKNMKNQILQSSSLIKFEDYQNMFLHPFYLQKQDNNKNEINLNQYLPNFVYLYKLLKNLNIFENTLDSQDQKFLFDIFPKGIQIYMSEDFDDFYKHNLEICGEQDYEFPPEDEINSLIQNSFSNNFDQFLLQNNIMSQEELMDLIKQVFQSNITKMQQYKTTQNDLKSQQFFFQFVTRQFDFDTSLVDLKYFVQIQPNLTNDLNDNVLQEQADQYITQQEIYQFQNIKQHKQKQQIYKKEQEEKLFKTILQQDSCFVINYVCFEKIFQNLVQSIQQIYSLPKVEETVDQETNLQQTEQNDQPENMCEQETNGETKQESENQQNQEYLIQKRLYVIVRASK